MAHEEARYIRGVLPYPSAPVMTLYSPSTTAYEKVTPTADALLTRLVPIVTTETLQYASVITHKIADATTITSDAPTDDAKDYARANEFKGDFNTHVAATAYHDAAGTAIATANASSEATLIALTLAIDAAMKAHAASTTEHGGRTDATFAEALATLALPAEPTKAECRTYLGDAALKAAWEAHLAVTDGGIYLTHGAAVMPLEWPSAAPLWCKTNVSAHTFAGAEFRSL
jgi:hypothetical protein